MREGERYAIMPFELELRDGQPGIHVRQQIQRYGRPGEVEIPNWLEATHLSGSLWLTTPKTPAAERFVPVSGSLWDRLWKWIRENGIGSHELVFTSARGNPVCSSTERYQWVKALKAAGLPQVKIHSARALDGHDGRTGEHAGRRARSRHGPHQHADDHALHPP